MIVRVARTRFLAGLSALLLALGAVMPQLLHLTGESVWAELCTTRGVERVAIDRDGNPIDEDGASPLSCPICTVGAKAWAIPTGALVGPVGPLGYRAFALPDLAEAHLLRITFLAAFPRAPPHSI